MCYFVTLLLFALLFIKNGKTYKIYTVDDPSVCNRSIYLGQGTNSAAILQLTSKDSYSTTPLYCTISFKVPIHNWSGLTGILEAVDLRRYEDTAHRLGQSVCVDHITVMTEKSEPVSAERQCGTWATKPGKALSRLGYNKALVGYCPYSVSHRNAEKCHVTELKVVVSIGRERQQHLWKNLSWKPHKGFTLVVTAYSYPIKNGESECRDGLRLCSDTYTPGEPLGVYHCVHDSLWCDEHVNCGFFESMDEISCLHNGSWIGVPTLVIAPWLAVSLFLLFIVCVVMYWRSTKLRINREVPSTNPEFNSYAESYELSSNLSSAHHMAIQVRVVCNSNHPHHGTRGGNQPWKNDLPPPYETLFPEGPPEPSTPITSVITVSQAISRNPANAGMINASSASCSTLPSPSTVFGATASGSSGMHHHPSSIQPMSGTYPRTDDLRPPPDITSFIDLNVTSNNYQPALLRSSDARSVSSVDTTITAANTQTSVTLTVTPNRQLAGEAQCDVAPSNIDVSDRPQCQDNLNPTQSAIAPNTVRYASASIVTPKDNFDSEEQDEINSSKPGESESLPES